MHCINKAAQRYKSRDTSTVYSIVTFSYIGVAEYHALLLDVPGLSKCLEVGVMTQIGSGKLLRSRNNAYNIFQKCPMIKKNMHM